MMPMADMFAPDINFVPARAVYPTMSGGTSASAGAAMSSATNVLAPDQTTGKAGAAVATDTSSVPTSGGHTVWWWVGTLLLLAIMVFVARKAGGDEDFRNIRPTAYNFLTITLTAIVGIVGLKVLAAKYRIPGASDLILAA